MFPCRIVCWAVHHGRTLGLHEACVTIVALQLALEWLLERGQMLAVKMWWLRRATLLVEIVFILVMSDTVSAKASPLLCVRFMWICMLVLASVVNVALEC